jgi:hydroxymethylglutaryl-CoA lyase
MLPKRVTIGDVSPRDGLQIEKKQLSVEERLSLINALGAAGVPRIEVAAFVNPKVVPSMANATEIVQQLRRQPGTRYGAFVPNARGAEAAIAAGIDHVKCGAATSTAFNELNIRMDRKAALAMQAEIGALPRPAGCDLVGTVGTAFGCPYEGAIPPAHLYETVEALAKAGCRLAYLADTTGMANPVAIRSTIEDLRQRFPEMTFGLHLHNTRGLGIANALAGLEAGVTDFEGSVGGLGGCPFAPRAVGNVCTEDLVHMFHEMGVETGIDLDALIAAARHAETLVEHVLPGMVMKAGKASELHSKDGRPRA